MANSSILKKMSLNAVARTAIVATISLGAAMAITTPASAGILINPQGIFLTEPEVSPFVANANGRQFGSPAGGFRRFGRSGFFPTPVDPTVPRAGQSPHYSDGKPVERQPHGKVESTLFDFLN